MAEIVQKNTEAMIRELEDLRQTKIFSDENIRRIVVARRHMESKINRMTKNIEDYRSYITHESLILKKIRRCRDKKKIAEKKNSVDFSIIQRIKKLYDSALHRYPHDFSLAEAYYKFSKEHQLISSGTHAVDSMIKMGSDKPEVWKIAAGWYRHLNDDDKALQMVHKGLTINPESTLLYTYAIELEIGRLSNNDSSAEERLFMENKCCEKIKTYVNLFLKSVKSFDYFISILTLLEAHSFTNPAQQLILDRLFKNYSKEDIVWHTLAKREKKGLHFVTDPNEQPRSGSYAKSCTMYCIAKYQQGLSLVADDKKKKLWCHYLDTLIEMQEETVQTQSIDRAGLLKTAFQEAHHDKCLEENYYTVWTELLPDDEARKILEEATSMFPQSEELWKMQLRYAIKTDSVNDVNVTFKLGMLALKERSLSLWLMLLRFHLLISENEKMRVIFEDGVKQPPEIANVLKPKYIEWIAFHEGIEAARAKYKTLGLERPFCKELHTLMAKLEFSQMDISYDSCQNVHELACAQFGDEDLEVWLNYVKFLRQKNSPDVKERVRELYDRLKIKHHTVSWEHFTDMVRDT